MPIEIARRAILSSVIVGGTVLDPFLGSGTTALVADQLGRDCIGIELSAAYAAMAERRIRRGGGIFASVAIDAESEAARIAGARVDMPRAPLTFRQRDVTAAIKAVEAAGHVVARVEIGPDGRIVVILVKPGENTFQKANEWDSLQ